MLNGHDHVYARYAPTDPTGKADPRRGIREIIVGTGGESLDAIVPNGNTPNLQASTAGYYGVMKLTLAANGHSWDFESALKSPTGPSTEPPTYSDTGSAPLPRGADRAAVPPPAHALRGARAAASRRGRHAGSGGARVCDADRVRRRA